MHWRLSYRNIGRHHTTISREVKRNGRLIACYRDGLAQNVRWFNARNRGTLAGDHIKNACIMSSSGYRRIGHRKQWLDASGWITPEVHVCGLARKVSIDGYTRMRHKKRLRQQQYGTERGLIPNCVSIHDRPLSAGNRRRFGHWRGDRVEGAKDSGGIATHVEGKSCVLVAAKLSDKSADTFYLATTTAFKITLEKWRKTLMVDNGKECAQFRKIEEATGMNVYFADPYSPWQRGTNENTNGLLRHYFPKEINWRKVTDLMFATVAKKLNNRLRKRLNY